LKSDYRNELFYEKCKELIIRNENSYENNNLKCAVSSSSNRLFKYGQLKNMNEDIKSVGLFSDYIFYLTYLLILSLLGPLSGLIAYHLISQNRMLIITSKKLRNMTKAEDELNEFERFYN
jgi:hypothetical protein